jgi:hypothetical protein
MPATSGSAATAAGAHINPEPASVALLGMGLAGLAAAAKKEERMKKLFILAILAIGFYSPAYALMQEIDFDGVSSMTNIDNQYQSLGVNFSTFGDSGFSDGSAYARSSSAAKSSPNVIGGFRTTSDYFWLNSNWVTGRADFVDPTNYVRIWANPANLSLSAWLIAYDSEGYVLDTVYLSLAELGQGGWLIYSSPTWNISRIEFSGYERRAAFDNLKFAVPDTQQPVIPEPTTMLLLGSGALGLAGLRFRKKRS